MAGLRPAHSCPIVVISCCMSADMCGEDDEDDDRQRMSNVRQQHGRMDEDEGEGEVEVEMELGELRVEVTFVWQHGWGKDEQTNGSSEGGQGGAELTSLSVVLVRVGMAPFCFSSFRHSASFSNIVLDSFIHSIRLILHS